MTIRTACLLACTLLASTAVAQSIEAADPMMELQALRDRVEQLNVELTSIQDAAFEADPALTARRDALMAEVDARMLAGGFDAESSRATMDSLVTAYEDSTLSDADRGSIEQEMQEAQGAYQQAQQTAMQDAEIQESVQDLNTALMDAMNAADPRTDELIAELQSSRQRFQMLMQQVMMQQQQMQPPVPTQEPEGQR